MGGKAFSRHDPPIHTPRLASEDYYPLRDRCIRELSTLFLHVASPIEAPSKLDHGDIDILVTNPRPEEVSRLITSISSITESGSVSFPQGEYRPTLQEQIAAVKGLFQSAAGAIQDFETVNLALPHPSQIGSYFQLDVHIVQDNTQWRWLLFQHSYGDFFSLLGTSLRLVGLVGTDKGFYLRDEEIEPHDRKKCLVFLTSEPIEVISFLGFDRKHWFSEGRLDGGPDVTMIPAMPFKSDADLFTAITRMRFFQLETYTRSHLKRADRSRMQSRAMYRSFVEEFLPTLLSQHTKVERKPRMTRAQVFQLALVRWNAYERWNIGKKAWEYDRLDLLTRQKFREKKKSDMARLCAYADAWTIWCYGTTIEVSNVS